MCIHVPKPQSKYSILVLNSPAMALDTMINEFELDAQCLLDEFPMLADRLRAIEQATGFQPKFQLLAFFGIICYYLCMGNAAQEVANALIIAYPVYICCEHICNQAATVILETWLFWWMFYGMTTAMEGSGEFLERVFPPYWLAKVLAHFFVYHPRRFPQFQNQFEALIRPSIKLLAGRNLQPEEMARMQEAARTMKENSGLSKPPTEAEQTSERSSKKKASASDSKRSPSTKEKSPTIKVLKHQEKESDTKLTGSRSNTEVEGEGMTDEQKAELEALLNDPAVQKKLDESKTKTKKNADEYDQ